ncbi:DUF2695 domain-containing protein [Aquipuribacter nitratireducens]|uniref:DUF2695 domain-containing protein n=1 Tax=Aquipuribacter nitratireducens TaxID=650104 RepID=A0ABW0GL48_9MICO
MSDDTITTAESHVHAAALRLTTPRDGECLVCFLDRQVAAFGCHTDLRFARLYRDTVAPRARGLETRLGRGGGFCDCECLMNTFEPARSLWVEVPYAEDPDGRYEPDRQPPATMPTCAGVAPGTVQPCANWTTRRRW